MKKLRSILLLMTYFAGTLTASSVVISVSPALADQQAAIQACNNAHFLTMPAWYRGLATVDASGNCIINTPDLTNGKFIWTLVMNIIEIGLNLVVYLTVGFIIYGGYKYILAAGAPDAMAKAKKTITNAVIGLVLSIVSVAIVQVIAGALG